MNSREDARVVRTKSKLLTTFKAMLCERSFEKISVQEICEGAGVKRATFYKHFEDKYAFLKYLVGSLRDSFDSRLPKNAKPNASSDYYVKYIHALVSFLTENEKMVNNALESELFYSLLDVIKDKNYEDTCERLRKSVDDGLVLPASVEITASMMTGAVANALIYWFKNGKQTPVDVLITEISEVIKSIAEVQN